VSILNKSDNVVGSIVSESSHLPVGPNQTQATQINNIVVNNNNKDLIDEDNWIPVKAFNIANEFRTKHGNDLSPELITELLRSLNAIWRAREKKQL